MSKPSDYPVTLYGLSADEGGGYLAAFGMISLLIAFCATAIAGG